MKLKKDATKEKITGTYYTPKAVASLIVKRLINKKTYNSVLEPSAGEGVFIDSLNESGVSFKTLTAVEIDSTASHKMEAKFLKIKDIKVINEDFFGFYNDIKNSKYDLIIGNPPYIRYQYLANGQREAFSNILKTNGMKPNKLSNAWVAFVVACETLLTEDGELCFIIPAELLQVGYSSELRAFLTTKFDNISVYTFKTLIFDSLQQETVILNCKKRDQIKGLRVVESENIEDLQAKDISAIPFLPFESGSKDKWTKYLTHNDSQSYILSDKFNSLSNYALINVGLTTGSNPYFCLTKETVEKYHLEEYCKPLLGKSNQAQCSNYTKNDYLNNIANGRRANILLLPDNESEEYGEGLKRYLELGIQRNIYKGYKCSIRAHWYSIPSVWYPDAFFQRRVSTNPKLIFNSCGAISTDTMHRVKINDGVNKKLLVSCFYNSVTFASAEINGRSYGGGVLEILPSEAGRVLVPNINAINDIDTESFFERVDELIREDKTYISVLDYVDKEVLVDRLGFSKEFCNYYRQKWIKLRDRRLNRGKDQQE